MCADTDEGALWELGVGSSSVGIITSVDSWTSVVRVRVVQVHTKPVSVSVCERTLERRQKRWWLGPSTAGSKWPG